MGAMRGLAAVVAGAAMVAGLACGDDHAEKVAFRRASSGHGG